MLSKIQSWGNSQGLRLNKQLLEEAHLKVGQQVDIIAFEGEIIIKPTSKIKGRYSLKDLVAKMPQNYKTQEANWGKAVGKEED
jgi:antitoxin MazE